jgi:hypothetical protein
MLLLSSATTLALATCVSKTCSDAVLVQRARDAIEQTCECTGAGQTHREYVKCVKHALKVANVPAVTLERPCRKLVVRCESKSICGAPAEVVCCKTKRTGEVVTSVRRSAAKCKNGTACGAALGSTARSTPATRTARALDQG